MRIDDVHALISAEERADAHPPGTVEHLYVVNGELEVTVDDEVRTAKSGEALRYHADRPHKVRNVGEGAAHAAMVLVLRQP